MLMKSPVHIREIQVIPDDFERTEILRLLETFGKTVKVENEIIRERIEFLISKGFGIADAADVAFSEYYNSIFISCDDKLLSRCSRTSIKIQCLNPVIFCEMENLK